jgi:hypothetical protein
MIELGWAYNTPKLREGALVAEEHFERVMFNRLIACVKERVGKWGIT